MRRGVVLVVVLALLAAVACTSATGLPDATPPNTPDPAAGFFIGPDIDTVGIGDTVRFFVEDRITGQPAGADPTANGEGL